MSRTATIDIHAHMLPEETIRLLGKESLRVAPKLIAQPDGSTIMEIAGKVVQRPMPPECWDLDLRLADMAKHGIDMQAVCATVHTFFYDEEPSLATACAVLQNDQIAAVVARHPDRFVGLAMLPLQAPQRAADELKRAMRSLGLRGAQIGTHVDANQHFGRIDTLNLDNAALQPVWSAAEQLGAAIFVHPWDMMGEERMQSYWLPWLVGMPAEVSLAICSVIFGGVLQRLPELRIAFAHGGGAFPGTLGRIEHGVFG